MPEDENRLLPKESVNELASIRKRANSYQITVSNGYDKHGKKIIETATYTPDPSLTEKQNERALQRYALEFEQMVISGKYLDGEKITFSQFAEKWFRDYAEICLEKDTVYNYRILYKTHIEPSLGHLKLARIQPAHLNRLYLDMTQSRKDGKSGGYSPNTIRRTHAVICSIMHTAVKWNILTDNPCDRVTLPKQERTASDIKFFTVEQTTAFLDAINTQIDDGSLAYQFKPLFHIAIFCGLRRSELIALEWKDVNFKESTISVNKATVLCGNEIVTKSTKNKSSTRSVSVPSSVMQLLKSYKAEQQKLRLSLGTYWKGSDYIFIKNDGSQMYPSTPYETMKRIINTYNETASDPLPSIPFHGLRHTSATLLIGSHVDVETVSHRLGHAETSTTLNIYSHALEDLDRKAADTLDDLLTRNAK